MCTAVVGGSIHRAATRISTASDQKSAAPMRNHRTKDRKKPFRCGVPGGVSGFSVTLQHNRLRWIDIAPASPRYRRLDFQYLTRPVTALIRILPNRKTI